MNHNYPIAQGRSGKVYCTGCLAKADTVAELQSSPCYADNYEN